MEALCPASTGLAFQFRLPDVSDTEHRLLVPEGWSCRLLVRWTSLLRCRTHWSPLCRRKLAQSAERPSETARKMRGAMAAVLLGWIHCILPLFFFLCCVDICMCMHIHPLAKTYQHYLGFMATIQNWPEPHVSSDWLELTGSSSYSHWAESRALWGWGLFRTRSPACPVSAQSTQGGRLLCSTLRLGGKTKNHRLRKTRTSFPIILLAILTFQVPSGTHPAAEETWSHMGQLLVPIERRLTP